MWAHFYIHLQILNTENGSQDLHGFFFSNRAIRNKDILYTRSKLNTHNLICDPREEYLESALLERVLTTKEVISPYLKPL